MSDEKPKPTSTDIMAAIECVGAQVSALAKAVDALAGTLAEHSAKLDAIRSAPTGAAPRANTGGGAKERPTCLPNYGRGANKPIADADDDTLNYYVGKARAGMRDKTGWKQENDRLLVEAIDAEIARRQSGANSAQATLATGAPAGAPPADDDTPF